MAYSDYLQSRHWKETRQTIFSIKGAKCEVCDSIENLHVHHKRYKKLAGESILGQEKRSHLAVLCNKCHSQWHGLYKKKETNSMNIKYARFLLLKGATRKKAFQFCTQKKVMETLITFYNSGSDNRIRKYIGEPILRMKNNVRVQREELLKAGGQLVS